MTTRRKYFVQNPDEFEKYVWKLSGKRPYTLDKDRVRSDGSETSKKAPEMVRPSHYELLPGVNVIDVIKAILNRTCYEPDENFYLGNAIKYILRADEKNDTEDYKKAITYLTWLVESLE